MSFDTGGYFPFFDKEQIFFQFLQLIQFLQLMGKSHSIETLGINLNRQCEVKTLPLL